MNYTEEFNKLPQDIKEQVCKATVNKLKLIEQNKRLISEKRYICGGCGKLGDPGEYGHTTDSCSGEIYFTCTYGRAVPAYTHPTILLFPIKKTCDKFPYQKCPVCQEEILRSDLTNHIQTHVE